MKAAQFRNMTVGELEEQIDLLRTELFNLRLGNTTKELQNPSRIKGVKRDLARVLTIIGEKQREAAVQA